MCTKGGKTYKGGNFTFEKKWGGGGKGLYDQHSPGLGSRSDDSGPTKRTKDRGLGGTPEKNDIFGSKNKATFGFAACCRETSRHDALIR